MAKASQFQSIRSLLGRTLRKLGFLVLPGNDNPLRWKAGLWLREFAGKLWPTGERGSTRVYTAAVIGAGTGGRLNLEGFDSSSRYRLAAVADVSRDALRAVKHAYPQVRTFTDHREMIEKCPTDVVCVATWAPSHLPIARDVLAAGAAHGIVMEKPLGATEAEGRELLTLLRNARMPVVVPHGLQVSDHVEGILKRVRKGEIGALKLVEIECTGWDLINAGIHWLNFVMVLLADDAVELVMSCCDNRSRTYRDGMQVETLGATYAQTRGGVRLVVNMGDYVNVSAPDKSVLFRIVGTAGQIEFYGWEPCYKLLNRQYPRGRLIRVKPGGDSAHQRYADALARQIDKGRPDTAGAETSLAALEVCEAAYLSAKHGCAVSLPLSTFTPPPRVDWEPGKPYSGTGGGRDGRRLPDLQNAIPGREAVTGLHMKEGPGMIRFGIVGAGWRTQFYLRVARACPDRFEVVGIVARDAVKVSGMAEPFGVPAFESIEEMHSKAKPMFVVSSVPWDVNPTILRKLAELGIPALSETPPATTAEDMIALWQLARDGARIQVAEQYWAQPHHAARIAFARSGKIGRVSQAQVSAAHGYHGVSLIRRYLGIGCEEATVTARAFTSPIVQSPGRDGPPASENIVPSQQTIAQLDFGDRLGVFDFSDDQYFSYIRGQRLLVRGDRGEIVDNHASYLQDFQTPIRVEFARQSAGVDGNLEGNYLKGIQVGEEWMYRNPLAPGELSDDEIAVGTCLLRMGEYVAGGEPFYSLGEACQDRYLHVLIEESLEKRSPVTAARQPWASEG